MGLDDCIEWEGSRFPRGYGRAPGGKYAHREAFFQAYGFYPPVVRHRCDNPPCVNPAHLVAGTQLDNLQDMFDRGRARRARGKETANGAKTHCKSGHEFTESNTRIKPNGSRSCRTCDREAASRSNAMKRERK